MSTRLRSKIQNLLENLDFNTSDLGAGDDNEVNTSASIVSWSAQRPEQDTEGSEDDHSDIVADRGGRGSSSRDAMKSLQRRDRSSGQLSPLEQLLSLERRVLQLMQEKQVGQYAIVTSIITPL